MTQTLFTSRTWNLRLSLLLSVTSSTASWAPLPVLTPTQTSCSLVAGADVAAATAVESPCWQTACGLDWPPATSGAGLRLRHKIITTTPSTGVCGARACVCVCGGMMCAPVSDAVILSVCSESIDEVIERHGLQRISLLREIAIKTGIQVRRLPYFSP